MQLPTQAQTPPVDFTLSSGEVGMRGMAAAGSQGGQATSARTQAPSRQRRQTTTQTPAPRLAGPAATPSSSDTLLRTLLARPMMPPSNPSSAASTIAPSVPRPLAPAGMLQRTTQAPTTRSSMATPASGNDHQLIHMLAQPYVDAELTHLRSVPPSSLTSTVASPVATPLPSAQGTQGTPFVPGPPVHVASAATAQPTLSAAPSTFPPFSSLGLTVEDLNQRDMMDEYLQGAPMGRIPVSTAPNPPQNFPLPGQMQATPMPTLVPAGIANVAQHPPGI
ncbi:MAG TPA: hypothetical protein VMR43_08590 [Variovorax sp.]|nr:hypothetical protein [Variovorax sp.]